METITIPSRFRKKPALTICGMLMSPVEKTIAFGGVATGSMNAIVFSTGRLSIPQMVRAGVALNIIGIIVVTLIALFLAPNVLV